MTVMYSIKFLTNLTYECGSFLKWNELMLSDAFLFHLEQNMLLKTKHGWNL